MVEALRRALFRLLRVPPDPGVPTGGDGAEVRVFRAAPNFYRYNLLRWGLGQLAALTGIVVGAVMVRMFSATLGRFLFFDIVVWLEIVAWVTFLVQLPLTYAALRLDYDLRWYIMTPRSLRIREGLVRIREQTMTFANVQNMSIQQGPLQRLLGIADVEVHTAGGGSGQGGSGDGGTKHLHVGTLRGVDNAEAVRDAIQARVRLHRDSGLGDPDDGGPGDAALALAASGRDDGAGEALLAASRELLSEARRLRGE